jgi:hypothetical protein
MAHGTRSGAHARGDEVRANAEAIARAVDGFIGAERLPHRGPLARLYIAVAVAEHVMETGARPSLHLESAYTRHTDQVVRHSDLALVQPDDLPRSLLENAHRLDGVQVSPELRVIRQPCLAHGALLFDLADRIVPSDVMVATLDGRDPAQLVRTPIPAVAFVTHAPHLSAESAFRGLSGIQ